MAAQNKYATFNELCIELEFLEYQLAEASGTNLSRLGKRISACTDECLALAEEIPQAYELLGDYRNLYKQFLRREDAQPAKSYSHVWMLLLFVILTFDSCNTQLDSPNLCRSGNSYIRTYKWVYNQTTYQFTFSVPCETYDHYATLQHVPIDQWNQYVLEDPDYPYLLSLDHDLYTLVANDHLTRQEFAQYLLSFVQSMNYHTHFEPFQIESPKSPVVSLMQGEKDCKDGSILFAAIASSMGYHLKLFALPGHMAIGITGFPHEWPFYEEGGQSYAYAETTCIVPIGTLPNGITKSRLEQAYPVVQPTQFNQNQYAQGIIQKQKRRTVSQKSSNHAKAKVRYIRKYWRVN